MTVLMKVNSQAGGGVERQAGDLLRRLPAHPHQLHHQVNLVTRRLLQRGTAHSAEESESKRRHTHTHKKGFRKEEERRTIGAAAVRREEGLAGEAVRG